MTTNPSVINASTPVQAGLGTLLATAAAFIGVMVGAIWVVGGGIKDDVSSIRKSLTDVQSSGTTTANRVTEAEAKALDRIRDADTKFGEQSLALQKEMVNLGGKFDNLGNRMSGLETSTGNLSKQINTLDDSMKSLSGQMTSLQRQLASLPNWNDPKTRDEFVNRVRAVINDPNQKVIIIPYGFGSTTGGPPTEPTNR